MEPDIRIHFSSASSRTPMYSAGCEKHRQRRAMRTRGFQTVRPAVTLTEVLVAIFVMGIGLLALLVLFPLGALSMAQAIRDDYAKRMADNATGLAETMHVRQDPQFYGPPTAVGFGQRGAPFDWFINPGRLVGSPLRMPILQGFPLVPSAGF